MKWDYFKCLLLGHKFYVVQKFSPETRKIACERCKKVWGMNDRVKAFVPWDSEFDEMYYDTFGYKKIKPWR